MKHLIDTFQEQQPTIYDFGEDGEWYYNFCHLCSVKFLGYKRRVTCKKCEETSIALSVSSPPLPFTDCQAPTYKEKP
jgi:hypothetical protein